MPHIPAYAQVSEAQKVLWRAELRKLMQSEQNLAPYVSMIDGALFFTADAQSESSLGFGAAQLIAYRELVQPKYVIVVFKVLKQHGEIGTSSIDLAMVEITLYAQASMINDDSFVNLVVSPNDQAPVDFICHATGCGSAVVNTITLGLNDLLDRFPQQVENILTQISFVAGLMPREIGGNQ